MPLKKSCSMQIFKKGDCYMCENRNTTCIEYVGLHAHVRLCRACADTGVGMIDIEDKKEPEKIKPLPPPDEYINDLYELIERQKEIILKQVDVIHKLVCGETK